MKNLWVSSGCFLAIAAACVALPASANAAVRTSDNQAGAVKEMTDGLISSNPGAQRVSDRVVRLANGVVAEASPAAGCPSGNLCINDAYSMAGNQWNLYNCGFVNIGNNGWSDKIRSFNDNQTGGVQSIFMKWDGSKWNELRRANAGDYRNFVDDSNPVHWTDGIWVC